MPLPLLLTSAPVFTAVTADLTLWLVEGPEPADVKAGWTAFALFLLLLIAIGLLGRSLVKHLRTAQAARDSGAYGDAPVTDDNGATEPHDGIAPR